MLIANAPQTVEQGRRRDNLDEGAAEFLLIGGHDLATELLVERLLQTIRNRTSK